MPKHVYTTIFDTNELGGHTVTFPDYPSCVTEGDNMEETVKMASKAMALHLYGTEQDGDEIPTPSNPAEIQIPDETSPGAFDTFI